MPCIPLYEKYRPKTWDELVGQDDAVRVIDSMKQNGGIGGAFWIVAQAGQGKNCIASLLAREVASEWAIDECDAQDLSIDMLRHFEEQCGFTRLDRSALVLIVNEAHTLRAQIVNRLKTTLENRHVQHNGLLIFTTTIAEQQQRELFEDDRRAGSPFMSRMHVLRLAPSRALALPFALRCMDIAHAEHLDGRPMVDYLELAKACECNFRTMLQQVQEGRMR